MNANSDQKFSPRVTNFWKQKTKLEKTLLIVSTILLLLLIGLVLFIIIIHTVKPKICKTTDCIISAAQIITHIDPTVDPCHDFFKFACGNFVKNLHGNTQEATIRKLKAKVNQRLDELLKEPISEADNKWMTGQKRMFQVCLNETDAEEGCYDEFLETLEELDGWPVVMGNHWKERSFDWKAMVYKLKERGHCTSMVFSVYVDDSKDGHFVQVFGPSVRNVRLDSKKLYQTYMNDVAVLFGADRNRAELEMSRVFDFAESLSKISDKFDSFLDDNDSDGVNETDPANRTKFTVREFQELHGDVDWLDFINTFLYPIAKITLDNTVVFPKGDLVEQTFKLINSTPKRVLANYIIWSALDSIMTYMPARIRETEKNFTCLIGSSNQNDKSRFEFCKTEALRSYFPQPLTIAYARKYLPLEEKLKFEEIVKNIKYQLIEMLKTNSWMDDESKVRAVEKANAIVDIIGAPTDYFNDAIFCQTGGMNETATSENETFFKLFLNQGKIRRDANTFKLHMSPNQTKLDKFYTLITTVDAMYAPLDNVMMFPAGILQEIFYNPTRPMYLNYGTIGSIIGHELTHGFAEIGNRYDKDGKPNKMWSNATEENYRERVKCIIEEAENFETDEEEFKVNGTLTLEENIADFNGLKLSYAAYEKWIRENGEEAKLSGIDYTPKQLFWISSISYECFEMTNERKKKDFHALNSFRVIGPMRNNYNFAEDFNCPVGSKMNPEKKCEVF